MKSWQTIAGWSLSALLTLFFLADGATALFRPDVLADAMAETGFAMSTAPIIGVLAIAPALLFVVPRTALLGAILLTGFLGGAICAHMRIDPAMTPHQLLLIGLGLAVWGALWLRDARLRPLISISS